MIFFFMLAASELEFCIFLVVVVVGFVHLMSQDLQLIFGAVRFTLVRCHAEAACTGLSS